MDGFSVRAALTSALRTEGVSRETSVDVARGVAIVGMVCINFPYMLAAGPPDASPTGRVLRWLLHLPSGRASSLFVTLAGLGLGLSWAKRPGLSQRFAMLVRAVGLFVLGVALHRVWNIDILHFYGAAIALVAAVFVGAPTLVLALAGATVLALGVALEVEGVPFRDAPFESPLGLLRDSFLDGVHPVFPWLAFMLYGLALARLDLRGRTTRRMLLGLALFAVGAIEFGSIVVRAVLAGGPWPGLDLGLFATAWTPAPLYVLSACGTATLVLVLAHEVTERGWPVRAFAAAGRRSLSIYLLHALVGVVLPVRVLGWGRALSIEAVALHTAVFLGATLALALLFEKLALEGPLEAAFKLVLGRLPRGLSRASASGATLPSWVPSRFLAGVGASLLALTTFVGVSGWSMDAASRPGAPLRGVLSILRPTAVSRIHVERTSDVHVVTRSGLDLIALVRAGAKSIAEDDDSGPGLDAELTTRLAPGDYEVLVRPYASAAGPYALEVTVTPVGS